MEKFGGAMGKQTVYQYEPRYPYALINKYSTTIEAAEAVSCDVKELYECCLGRLDLAGGYDWMLESNQHKKESMEQYGTHRCAQALFYNVT